MYERRNADEPAGSTAAPEPDLDSVPPGPELMAMLLAPRPDGSSGAAALDRVAAWERIRCLAEAEQATAVAEFTSGADEFAADEVALRLHVARGTAAARIDFARRLTRLGLTHRALGTGRIGSGVAHRIVDGLTAGDETGAPRLTGATLRLAEQIVLADAEGRTPGQVRSRVAHTVLLVDPAATQKRHAKAVADRTVRLHPGEDGMATLWALLPADDAVLVMQNLRRRADAARTPADRRTVPQRLADAFVDLHVHTWPSPRPCLCTDCPGNTTHPPDAGTAAAADAAEGVAGAGPDGGSRVTGDCTCGGCTCGGTRPRGRQRGRDRDRSGPLMRVVVAATTLRGPDSRPGQLAGSGPVPAELARRLAADPTGSWRRLLTDPATGALLDVGRTSYRPPAALDEFADPDDPDTVYWTTRTKRTYTSRPRAPLEPP